MTATKNVPFEAEQQDRATEMEAAERLDSLRRLEESWEEYRHVMRHNSRLFQEAGAAIDGKNFFVQNDLAACREVESYVSRLADEQLEFLEDAELGVRSASEEELARLRQGKAGE